MYVYSGWSNYNKYTVCMQYKSENTVKLIKAFGEIIKEQRENSLNKSQTLFAYEYDLDSGNLCRIENGKIEPKLTMMWRIAEAIGIPLSLLIKKLEDKLGDDFCIINK